MLLLLILASCSSQAVGWAPAKAPLMTRWAADVHPDQVPEYPRPELKRSSSSWTHLNGLWQVDYHAADLSSPPFNKQLPDEILVSFQSKSV